VLKKIIKAIYKSIEKDIKEMFESKWEYMELGSSQTDLVESYVLRTIKETLERELK